MRQIATAASNENINSELNSLVKVLDRNSVWAARDELDWILVLVRIYADLDFSLDWPEFGGTWIDSDWTFVSD